MAEFDHLRIYAICSGYPPRGRVTNGRHASDWEHYCRAYSAKAVESWPRLFQAPIARNSWSTCACRKGRPFPPLCGRRNVWRNRWRTVPKSITSSISSAPVLGELLRKEFPAVRTRISRLILSNPREAPWKENAIGYCAQALQRMMNRPWIDGYATLVPVPCSKIAGHADHDDRLLRVLQKAFVGSW
jgi:hypothetical protein